ncbi:MAG: PAS domain S-box protein [Betaproteobacteria bacterium]|nr:MAG: PAS domain S-box protein [Betaproteobacteria bacterium]
MTDPPLKPERRFIPRLQFARSEPWVAVLLFTLGASIAVIAGLMIRSWHLGEPPPTAPVLEAIQYDTAWIFAFCGVALALQAVGYSRAARLIAAVPIVVAGLRLAAAIAPGSLPIHPLLANPWLPYKAGDYDDMGVLTALVAIVTGSALASFGPRSNGRGWHAIMLALLGAIAMALSLLMAVGSWSGSSVTLEVLQFTSGERTNALLFIVLAGSVLFYAVLGNEVERQALRRTAPLIVWLSAFACVLVLWRALSVEETRFVQRGTALLAADARGQIERELRERVDTIWRFGLRTPIYQFDPELMRRDAKVVLQSLEEVRSVGWAGPDYIIRWVTPVDFEGRVAGFDARSDPRRREAVELAVATREPTLSKFTDLLIGGEGVVIYVPVYVGDELKGILSATLAKGNWLTSVLGGRFPDHRIELIEDSKVQLTVGADEPAAPQEWAQELPLTIRNAKWTLRVTPSAYYIAGSVSRLPDAALVLGILMATLLAVATYLFQAARLRARELNQANLRLVQDISRRYHVEQELRESEARTRLIINAVKDCAIYMLDKEGRVASWSPGAQALYGYDAKEIIARHFAIFYPPDRKQPLESELAVAARRGWFEEECWHLRKDGTRFSGDDIISAIRDEQGHLRGFSAVTRDVMLRIQLREQTERARDFYMALFTGFPNLAWRSDAYGACDYVNQAWLDYTGRKREAELGAGWLDSVHPEDHVRWRAIVDLTFPAREPFELEFRLRRADGRYGWFIGVGRPYHDMQGVFAGYLCSCYDNTARRAMEDALRESEDRYERITANVPGMVFKLRRESDGRKVFRYVSRGCQAITGLDEATIGSDANAFFNLIEAADRAHLMATLDGSAEKLSAWKWSGRLHPKQQLAEKWITIRAAPRRDDDGATVWDGVVFDDTASRLQQLELERSREELRALSRHLQSVREDEKASIAREVHDELGATLSALKMDLEWLGEHSRKIPEAVEKKRIAMIQLVDAAVAATRKIVTELRPSVLDDLGLVAALRWQTSAHQKSAKARVHLTLPDAPLVVDPERALALFRIFQETLTNVSRHAKATNIWVRLDERDGAYVLTVRDDGVGISPEDSTKPTSHGLRGMRERAQQLGGDVSISGEPDEGTTLIASIPKEQPEHQSAG